MNNKQFWFDLRSFSLDAWRNSLISSHLEGKAYYIELFNAEGERIGVPFKFLRKIDEKDEECYKSYIEDLYNAIIYKVSFVKLNSYTDESGFFYKEAFKVCVSLTRPIF
jgi:hypothetical protein